jgi:AraC family transcriptional regulator, regulatory protein of adaptative response / DNA-3-methyladenine glycosylase II
MPDVEQCHRAVRSRDRRFDGWFYVAVTSTRIYCRPSCPAITPRAPKPENLRFYSTAAAAQQAGFRACRRCLPDAAPGSPEWDGRVDVAARAMRLIDDGVVDREGVAGLAARLGYTARHLGRVLAVELGARPIDLARARRAHTARVLLETTSVPITDVSFAAGFGSVRQFNDTIRTVFGMTPSDLRRRVHRLANGDFAARLPLQDDRVFPITLRLSYREPYDWDGVLAHLTASLVPGLEEVSGRVYRRSLRLPHGSGIVEMEPMPGYIRASLRLDDLRDLSSAVGRVRRLTHADADPTGLVEALGRDPVIGDLVSRRPGLRVPGSVDPFETAVRAIISQRVPIQRARTIVSRLVQIYGTPLPERIGSLTHTFPAPTNLTSVDAKLVSVFQTRSVAALACAVDAGEISLDPGADRDETTNRLLKLPGIDDCITQYVALRGLGDPDAFPATDAGIRRAMVMLGVDNRPDVVERWRPLRSYAAQHLWTAAGDDVAARTRRIPAQQHQMAFCPGP